MSTYQTAYKKLNAAQRQAVDTTDGPVLVIAGPGTGKTQLLTTRIAHILATTDTQPANILCLTFTDTAATAMRERLTSMIGQAAYAVTISTYHAFGSDLLQRYPEYFTQFADLTAADDLQIDQCMRQAQALMPYSNPLKHEVFLHDIASLISDYKRALLKPADIRKIIASNLSFLDSADQLVFQNLASLTRIGKASLPLFVSLLQAGSQLPKPKETTVTSLQELWLTSLADAVAKAEETQKTTSLTAWKNQWLSKNADGQFIAAGRDTMQKQLAASSIYEQYLSLLQSHKLYDYDDMIVEAVNGLTANPELRYSLQEIYQYLMLDEFQDTNGAQLKLVELMTDSPSSEGRPNVLAVGDDDQAIYAFQGARYSHMLEFYNHYRGTLVVPLTENYRSQAGILALSSAVADQINERLHHNFGTISKQLVGKRPAGPCVIERDEFSSEVSQYAWIAKQVAELIKGGLPASDIAVLAPKHKFLVPLLPYLRQHGIAVRYDKREDILSDPAISELVLISRLLLALASQKVAVANQLWPQVLGLTYWHIPTSAIWQVAWQSSGEVSWTEKLFQQTETRPVALFFMRLSLLADHEPLETMLDYLIGSKALPLHEGEVESYTSGFYRHYFGDALPAADQPANFWQLLSNLTVLRSRLRTYQQPGTAIQTLADFVSFADAHQAAGIKVLNTSPYNEAAEAITVMTAFKAKGQEFAAVFVIAASDEMWGSRARNQASRIAIPTNLQFIRYAGASEDERLRLFFVALTRAKSYLYITNYRQDFSGKQYNRLKYLNETDDGELVHSPLLPVGDRVVVLPSIVAPTLPELDTHWHERRHLEAIDQPTLRNLLAERLRSFQLTATQLNRYTDVTISGPTSFLMRDLLRFPSGSSIDGTYGDVIHATLHWLQVQLKVHGTLPTLQACIDKSSSLLVQADLDEQARSQLIDRATTCLQAYLKQRAPLLTAEDIGEYSFKQEAVFIGEAHLSGAVDRIILDDATMTATIVDFKTGRSHSRWSKELKLEHYKQQLYFYKLLVENSTSFKNYVVTDAYLEFVQPDTEGIIHELHLSFDETTLQEYKVLIQNSWQLIQQLHFPDVSEYSENLAGVQAFQKAIIDGTL